MWNLVHLDAKILPCFWPDTCIESRYEDLYVFDTYWSGWEPAIVNIFVYPVGSCLRSESGLIHDFPMGSIETCECCIYGSNDAYVNATFS